jgi:hypothetical protein
MSQRPHLQGIRAREGARPPHGHHLPMKYTATSTVPNTGAAKAHYLYQLNLHKRICASTCSACFPGLSSNQLAPRDDQTSKRTQPNRHGVATRHPNCHGAFPRTDLYFLSSLSPTACFKISESPANTTNAKVTALSFPSLAERRAPPPCHLLPRARHGGPDRCCGMEPAESARTRVNNCHDRYPEELPHCCAHVDVAPLVRHHHHLGEHAVVLNLGLSQLRTSCTRI